MKFYQVNALITILRRSKNFTKFRVLKKGLKEYFSLILEQFKLKKQTNYGYPDYRLNFNLWVKKSCQSNQIKLA